MLWCHLCMLKLPEITQQNLTITRLCNKLLKLPPWWKDTMHCVGEAAASIVTLAS